MSYTSFSSLLPSEKPLLSKVHSWEEHLLETDEAPSWMPAIPKIPFDRLARSEPLEYNPRQSLIASRETTHTENAGLCLRIFRFLAMIYHFLFGQSQTQVDTQVMATEPEIQEALIELRKNPLFNAIWQEVNKTRPLTFAYKKLSTQACYSPRDHQIRLDKRLDSHQGMTNLLFETINALQILRFQEVDKRAQSTEMNREQYTMLSEWIETQSAIIHHRVAEYGISRLGWKSQMDYFKPLISHREGKPVFAAFWELANRSKEGTRSHADSYRKDWDRIKGLKPL